VGRWDGEWHPPRTVVCDTLLWERFLGGERLGWLSADPASQDD